MNPATISKKLLSNRESQVLTLLAKGASVRQAASALGLSIKTVDTHVSSIMKKTAAPNRVQAIRWALRNGLATIGADDDWTESGN